MFLRRRRFRVDDGRKTEISGDISLRKEEDPEEDQAAETKDDFISQSGTDNKTKTVVLV